MLRLRSPALPQAVWSASLALAIPEPVPERMGVGEDDVGGEVVSGVFEFAG